MDLVLALGLNYHSSIGKLKSKNGKLLLSGFKIKSSIRSLLLDDDAENDDSNVQKKGERIVSQYYYRMS